MRLPKDLAEKFLSEKQTEHITFDSMAKYLRSAIGLFTYDVGELKNITEAKRYE